MDKTKLCTDTFRIDLKALIANLDNYFDVPENVNLKATDSFIHWIFGPEILRTKESIDTTFEIKDYKLYVKPKYLDDESIPVIVWSKDLAKTKIVNALIETNMLISKTVVKNWVNNNIQNMH